MIERPKLGLKEITRQEYDRYMAAIGKPRPPYDFDKSDWGFAEITEPLEFESCGDLLRNFAETENARRVSVKRKESERVGRKKWWVFNYNELDDANIAFLVEKAEEQGFLYVSFFWKETPPIENVNNEIGFELITPSKRVRSSSIEIPGRERELYSWDGSEKEYVKIKGIYIPPSKKDVLINSN